MSSTLPFKISALVFIQNSQGEHLLIERRKKPNLGCWSPIGGKLETDLGESPYECAKRETNEEIGLTLGDKDLHCFGYISEKGYEGSGHWLMFLFRSSKTIHTVPSEIDEGRFRFFKRDAIDDLKVPETDRTLVWPYFDRYATDNNQGFFGLRADCHTSGQLKLQEELSILP